MISIPVHLPLTGLRARVLLILAIAFLVIFGVNFYHMAAQREARVEDAKTQLRYSAEMIVTEHRQIIKYTNQVLLNLMPEIRQIRASGNCSALLARQVKDYPEFRNLAIAALDGDVICSAQPLPRRINIADREYFQQTLKVSDMVISGVIISRSTGTPTYIFSRVLRDEAGRPDGVYYVALDLSWLQGEIAKSKHSAGSRLGLLDANGQVLARYPDPEGVVGKSIAGTKIFNAILAVGGNGVVEDETPVDGVRRIIAVAPFVDTVAGPVFFFVGAPKNGVTAPIERDFALDVGVLLALLAVTFAVIWFGSERVLLRPIAALCDAARKLGEGDYTVGGAQLQMPYAPLRLSNIREVRALQHALAESADKLQRAFTERQRAEEERLRLATIVMNSDDAIISMDVDGVIQSWNSGAERLFGFSADEIVGRPIALLHPPERRDEEEEILRRLAAGERIEHYETVRLTKDQRRVDVSATASPMVDAQGRIIGASKIARNITRRKRAEEALQRSEEQYRTLFDALMEGFCIIEVLFDEGDRPIDYRFLEINPAFEAQTGLHDAQGKRMRELAPGHEAHWFEFYGKIALTGVPARFVNEAAALGRWYDVSAYRVGGPGSRKVAILFNDITERKRYEAKIQQLNLELEQRVVSLEAANNELDAFAYSVSHDLRAPLRAADAFSRILLEKHSAHMEEDAQHCLQMIRDNAVQMGRLIDDLLAFSRLSRLPLRKELVQNEALVRAALHALETEQNGRQIELTIGELPAAQADPRLLRQVWTNLLANALKYTRGRDKGIIRVGAENIDGVPAYFVQDNGVGFDMRYAHKLFGVFQRLHRAEDYEGTGVGLAIVQRIVNRHGGRIWARAARNEGATFYFTLQGEDGHAEQRS